MMMMKTTRDTLDCRVGGKLKSRFKSQAGQDVSVKFVYWAIGHIHIKE